MLKTKPSAFVFCLIVFLFLQEAIGLEKTTEYIVCITCLHFWYKKFI